MRGGRSLGVTERLWFHRAGPGLLSGAERRTHKDEKDKVGGKMKNDGGGHRSPSSHNKPYDRKHKEEEGRASTSGSAWGSRPQPRSKGSAPGWGGGGSRGDPAARIQPPSRRGMGPRFGEQR